MKPCLPSLLPALRSSTRRRRGFLAPILLAAAGMSLPQLPAIAQSGPWSAKQWVGTWGSAPAGPPLAAQTQSFSRPCA
jgi:hypothetical protein